MSEIWLLKVSWSTDMSPTASSDTTAGATAVPGTGAVGEGCTRGGVVAGWAGRAIPGTQPAHPRTLYLVIFSHKAIPTAK